MKDRLDNYNLLVKKVNDFCLRITADFSDHIACRTGCDTCCRHLTLFPVEAVSLAIAFREIPGQLRQALMEKARKTLDGGDCPLLVDGLCALYSARPLICRTHGLPLLTTEGDHRRVDFCPLNFCGMTNLPGDAVLDLDRLNSALVSINALFISQYKLRDFLPDERLTISRALLLDPQQLP